MRIALVRRRSEPGGGWQLAVWLADERWLLLEPARQWLLADDPRRGHNSALLRQPITTLDRFLAEGRGRIESLAALVEPLAARPDALEADGEGEAAPLVEEASGLHFGPPVLSPPTFRDFYAFERHVATMWRRRDAQVPEAWYRLPIFYYSNTSEIRGPGEAVWAPRGSSELDYELEVAAVVDTPGVDRDPGDAEELIGGYTILNDWSARDLQRDETTVRLGPAKGKDFASSIGPWLTTPDELADVRSGKGYDLAMTARVNDLETSRGTWADAHFSFGEMLARASADVRLRAGDLIGSGTVGGGCLLEVRDETLGRYLEPGDSVTLAVDRLGELSAPVVERPSTRRAADTTSPRGATAWR
jgi:fumarylacetoacetate (FAA) hydrolase